MQVVATVFSLVLIIFGFAGGGGSSSSSGGGGFSSSSSYSSSSYGSSNYGSSSDGDSGVLLGIAIFVFLIVIAILFSKFGKNSFVTKDYNSTDQEKQIHARGREIFEQYQGDWSAFNLEGIKTYTTDHYYQHAVLMLEALKNLHRQNLVSNLKVNRVLLRQAVDSPSSLPLSCSITFVFDGTDEVVDTKTNTVLYHANAQNVSETWNFIYDGKDLRLSGISQPTESAPHLLKALADFADKNQLFYSPDWGRYALPNRGLIFDDTSLKVSDVNNHIIGKWQDVLVQLYTYAKIPGTPSSYCLVGQLNVPKDYLGIIVKSKKYRAKKPKDYEKFELEWNEFNQRYDVYASKYDAISAFELLNPKFMELLHSKRLAYNLEIVDNMIYIFAPVTSVSESDYAELLDILLEAYKELKL